MTLAFILFGVSFIILIWSGKILLHSITGISKILGLSEFLTAFFLVAFATSIPELFVGLSSVVQGVPGLSLGNIMGANLVNLTLVVGISIVLAGTMRGDGKISSQNFWLIFLIAFLPIFLAVDGIISRGDGLLLLIAFGLYVAKIFRDRQYFHKEMDSTKTSDLRSIPAALKHFSRFLGAIVLLLGSSFLLIGASRVIVGEYFDANIVFFGILFIALGTALPELVFGIRASLTGHSSAMLGNALGSVAFNSAAVVGIVALLHPITLNFTADFLLISVFLFAAFVFFHLFVYTRRRLTRTEGIVLLLVYITFVIISLFLQ